MSNFQPPHAKVAWIERRLNALESMVRKTITPQGVISSGTTAPIGIPFTHTHTGTSQGGLVDASPLTYTPAVLANWTGSADPGGVKDGLDQLASRTTTLETASTSGYLLLAGRAGGQTAKGGTAASENLTLQSTAHATRGVIAMSDSATIAGVLTITTTAAADVQQITLSGSSTHVTTGRFLQTARTVTLDDPATTNVGFAGIGLSPTFNWNKAYNGAVTMLYGFLWNPTVQNSANVTPGPMHGFVDDSHINIQTNTLTLTPWISFRSHPYITAATGGVVTVTDMYMFYGGFRDIPASSTVTTIHGFYYESPSPAPVGTLTTQVGLDIAALTGATNNYAIRVANTVQINSGAVMNLYSDVATTLSGSWDASTGRIVSKGMTIFPADLTYTTQTRTINVASGRVITLDFVNTNYNFIQHQGTVKYKQAGSAVGMGNFFSHGVTWINDASVSVNPGPINVLQDGATVTVDTATSRTMASYITVFGSPTINRTNSGTMTVTKVNTVESNLTIGAGITVTTRMGLLVKDASNSGTLTTQVGVDIEALAGGSTNFGIRNASNSVQTKYARFGAVTAGSNITDGDISALRAAFGTDAAIPAGGAILFINNPTIGNDVARFTSIATNDDPTMIVIQDRGATTDGVTLNLHSFTVPTSTAYMIRVHVQARRTGGSSGATDDMAGYVRTGIYKNNAGTTAVVGAIANDFTAENQAAWDCTLTTTGSGTVVCQVTGAANNNVTWHMTAFVMPVST